MTDAPKTIYVRWPHKNGAGLAFSIQSRPPFSRTEYTRTDIAKAELSALQAENAKLREAADALADRAKSVFASEYHNTKHLEGAKSYYDANMAALSAYRNVKGENDAG